MRPIGMFLLLFTLPLMAAEQPSLDPGGVNPGFIDKPSWFKQTFLDLPEDVEEAASQGRRVMLYFHQDGCPYCAKLIQDNFSQQTIAEKTKANFDVVEVNMWGDREVTDLNGSVLSEKGFSVAMKVMYTPTLIILNERGEVALRINGYFHPGKFSLALDYASGKTDADSLAEYLRGKEIQKASGKLHSQPFFMAPPYLLARQQGGAERPLMVLFEQKVCERCDEVHSDHFKRADILQQIERFDVVRLDMWSDTPLVTPAGRRTRAKAWARELGIDYAPTMVFFDRQGSEVFRSEAYLRSFHTASTLDYVASAAYLKEPEFQRYIAGRADTIEAQGGHVDLWQ